MFILKFQYIPYSNFITISENEQHRAENRNPGCTPSLNKCARIEIASSIILLDPSFVSLYSSRFLNRNKSRSPIDHEEKKKTIPYFARHHEPPPSVEKIKSGKKGDRKGWTSKKPFGGSVKCLNKRAIILTRSRISRVFLSSPR